MKEDHSLCANVINDLGLSNHSHHDSSESFPTEPTSHQHEQTKNRRNEAFIFAKTSKNAVFI